MLNIYIYIEKYNSMLVNKSIYFYLLTLNYIFKVITKLIIKLFFSIKK